MTHNTKRVADNQSLRRQCQLLGFLIRRWRLRSSAVKISTLVEMQFSALSVMRWKRTIGWGGRGNGGSR